MEFYEHIKNVIGNEYLEKLKASLDEKELKCFRVNELITSTSKIKNTYPNIKENKDIPYSFYYDKDEYELGKSLEHFNGEIYIQDASAMLVSHLLNPKENEKVIDLCAAPGGKATQAAILMKNTGLVIANEISEKRVMSLVENVERLNISNCIVTNNDIPTLAKHFQGYFDKVILDAPCSGEGMFRRNELSFIDWSIEKVERLAALQKELILDAYKLLRRDGIMVYSTCTFEEKENEEVVKYLLENTNASLISLDIDNKISGINLKEALRLYPFSYDGEGQFICLIKCNDDHELTLKKYKENENDKKTKLKIVNEFIKENTNYQPLKDIMCFKDNIYHLPFGNLNIDNLKVKTYGINVGKIIKNRLEPTHVFMKNIPLKNEVELSLADVNKYLHGETISCQNLKGYVKLNYLGVPFAFGKASNGMIKNHLPKYLRK